jgi:hypothetical protein
VGRGTSHDARAGSLRFIIRVILVYTLPTALVLAISPILLNGIYIATIAWMFAYIRYATRRGQEMEAAQDQVTAL